MPDDLQSHWTALCERMLSVHNDVAPGKMMSADALTWGGKVFVFFTTKGGRVGLGCRVGRDLDLSPYDLSDWQHLAPFKTKPPMKDWIVLGAGDLARWSEFADLCLERARQKEA